MFMLYRLLDELDASTTPPQSDHQFSATADPATRVKRLVGAYRELKREHEEVVKRYAAEHDKWRRWKQWLRGGSATPRRIRKGTRAEKQKENVGDEVLDEDSNGEWRILAYTNHTQCGYKDITLVEAAEPLSSTSEWPRTPKKQPLTPSRRDTNSPSSPSTSSAIMNDALKAAASKRDIREPSPHRCYIGRAKIVPSPIFKKSPAPKFRCVYLPFNTYATDRPQHRAKKPQT